MNCIKLILISVSEHLADIEEVVDIALKRSAHLEF